jgi:hypothetical protein
MLPHSLPNDDLARLILRSARRKPSAGPTRLIWLIAETASHSGYCSKTPQTLGVELLEPPGAVERWRQALVAMDVIELKPFKRERGQERRYYLIRRPGEGIGDAYKRIRRDQRLDLILRCLWLLHDITRPGPCEVTQAEIAEHLGVKHQPQISVALGRALALGYFTLQPGNGRGHPGVYSRAGTETGNILFPSFFQGGSS